MGFTHNSKHCKSVSKKNWGQGSSAQVLDNIQNLPLPKGSNPYALGKQAEHMKDLETAKLYYMTAIEQGDKVSSAVKDYASILHQQHRTSEAMDFLEKSKSFVKDSRKLQNLYKTFQKQIKPSPNCLNKTLRIQPISKDATFDDIETLKALFSDSSRILKVSLQKELAFLHFQSHSAARKTLEKFLHWNKYTFFWVSDSGVVQNEVGSRHLVNLDAVPEVDAVMLLGKELYELIK